MKRFKSMKLIVLIALIIMIINTPVYAQEWSAAQKEVWKNVETYNALFAAGDLEGSLAYFHQDYRGWSYQNALPMNKATLQKFMAYYMEREKIILYHIEPVDIQIFGAIAVVHYYTRAVYNDVEGKVKVSSGRWTDILLKQADKWVLIGDHGGETSKE